jgi:hypothetical protein
LKKQTKILLIFLLLLADCKKDNSLPNPTQQGLNTLEMLVNGNSWWAVTDPFAFDGSPSLVVYYSPNGQFLIIHAINYYKKEKLYFYAEKIKSEGYFSFSRKNNHFELYHFINYSDSTCFKGNNEFYSLSDSTNSSLNITRLDTLRNIISGLFSMTLLNNKGTYVTISEGRFDATYLK